MVRGGRVGSVGKVFACRHENLPEFRSLGLVLKARGINVHLSSQTGKANRVDSWTTLASQLPQISELRVQQEALSQNSFGEKYPKLILDLHVYDNPCTHVYMQLPLLPVPPPHIELCRRLQERPHWDLKQAVQLYSPS